MWAHNFIWMQTNQQKLITNHFYLSCTGFVCIHKPISNKFRVPKRFRAYSMRTNKMNFHAGNVMYVYSMYTLQTVHIECEKRHIFTYSHALRRQEQNTELFCHVYRNRWENWSDSQFFQYRNLWKELHTDGGNTTTLFVGFKMWKFHTFNWKLKPTNNVYKVSQRTKILFILK